jgi:hypothetical protein
VLATAFVLSLAVNIWWGIDRRGTDPPLSAPESRPVYAYHFLQTIQSPKAIGSLVASHPAVEAPFVGLGFALQDPRVVIFRMGILYIDALAALHSGTLDVATRRVDALGKAMHSLQAPPLLSHYLTEIHTLLQNRQYTGQELAKFLALFELLYEQELGTDAAEVRLFRFGAWSENMALAVAASDHRALRQAAGAPYLRTSLLQLDAPASVIEAFDRIQRLSTTTTLTDADLRACGSLVRTIQKTLGALPH